MLCNLRSRTADFARSESGTGTVFSIFAIAMFIMIGGIAIDASSLWKHEQHLKHTADLASHAGVVQLAFGNDEQAALAAAEAFVESNMPAAIYGNLYYDKTVDISLLHYDVTTNKVSTTGEPNAVAVMLHRDGMSGNPVSTFALRLSDIFLINEQTNLSEWNVRELGITALAEFQGCKSTDGIYADGQVSLSSSSTFGGGYCLHGQDDIWMAQQNTFMPTAALSMPNLDDCGSKCTDAANPGSTAAAWERNLIMPDIEQHILDSAATFLGTLGGDPAVKTEFFSDKPLETAALYALEAEGIKTDTLTTGSVVQIKDYQFEALAEVPEGLVYQIECKDNGNPDSVRVEFGAKKNKPGKNGGEYFTPTDVKNIAMVTNCAFEFLDATDAKASVLISTRLAATHTVTAGSGAKIGDLTNGCAVGDQTIVMALSDMSVPADFAGSNVSFVIDGDINLSASSSSTTINHSGVSFHASGDIKIASNHTFDSCAIPPAGMIPRMLVIRHVAPDMSDMAVGTY